MKQRQPIKRKTQLKRSTKPISRVPLNNAGCSIKKVAEHRATDLKTYTLLRKDFLADNPKCMGGPLCSKTGCDGKSVEVHHSRGRQGWLLNEIQYWKAVSRQCHVYIELNPNEAKELGLSDTRMVTNRVIGWYPGK